MKFSAVQISTIINGTIKGNKNAEVNDISKIEDEKPGTITFIAHSKYLKYLETTEASIVIINNELVPRSEVKPTLICVDNAYESFMQLLNIVQRRITDTGISRSAHIEATATIGENVYVGHNSIVSANVQIGENVKILPLVYIDKNVQIGNNTIIMPGTVILENCIIGSNCTIHSGVVIGTDGFGYMQQEDGSHNKVPQLGNVIIEDNVEIGANSTIDRATMGSTIVQRGTKIDNLVIIAHNVNIGENCILTGKTAIAGSSILGKRCIMGGRSGISDHVTVGDDVIIGGCATVFSDVKNNSVLLGTPAIDIRAEKRSIIVYRKLPELQRKITSLEKEIEELKKIIKDKE